METNIPIEQAIVQKPVNKKYGSPQKKANLAKLDNGPMLSTAEILDFASGTDSTPNS